MPSGSHDWAKLQAPARGPKPLKLTDRQLRLALSTLQETAVFSVGIGGSLKSQATPRYNSGMTPSLLFGPFWRCYPGSLVRCLPLLDCRFKCSLNMLSFTSRLHTACDYGLQNVIQHSRVAAGNPVNVREPVQYWSYWSLKNTSITLSSPNPGALCLTPCGPFF